MGGRTSRRVSSSAPPRLVVVAGWIASGKSTVARAVAAELGAELLVADELRAELGAHGAPQARLPGFSETLYPALLERAERALAARRPVVLDATFRQRAWREAARALAARHGGELCFVECRAPEAVCRARLAERGGAEEVRGWLSLFEHFIAHHWEPLDEIPPRERLVLDTSRPVAETLAELRLRLA